MPSESASSQDDLRIGPWKCFHCGETFHEYDCARDHFGIDELDLEGLPACIERLTDSEKTIIEARREWRRKAERRAEKIQNLEYEINSSKSFIRSEFRRYRRWGDVSSLNDLRNLAETMEGEILALEEHRNFLLGVLQKIYDALARIRFLGKRRILRNIQISRSGRYFEDKVEW